MGAHTSIKSGGNATVPDDAVIQPPQAFVDTFYFGNLWSDTCVINENATKAVGAVNYYIVHTNTRSLPQIVTVNAKLPSAEVGLVLSAIAPGAAASGQFDLSGAYMGVPPPAQAAVVGTAIITVPVEYTAGTLCQINTNFVQLTVVLDDGVALADSGPEVSGPPPSPITYRVGISDTPTAEEIASKLAEISGLGEASGRTLPFTITDSLNLPLDDAEGSVEITAEGVAFVPNADITTIVGVGASVTVMEYVNRISGETVAVAYP